MTPAELKRIRKHTHLSFAKMAAQIGVTPQSIWRWEHGRIKISEPMAQLIRLKYVKEEKK